MAKENIDLLDLYSIDPTTGQTGGYVLNEEEKPEENEVKNKENENIEEVREEGKENKVENENNEEGDIDVEGSSEIGVEDLAALLEDTEEGEEGKEEEGEEKGETEEVGEEEVVEKEGDIEEVKEDLQDIIEDLRNEISDEYIRKLVELEQQLTEYQIKDELRQQKLQELLQENQRLKDELLYYKNNFGEGEENPEYEVAKILILAKENPKYKKIAIEKLKTALEDLTGEPINLNVSELFSEEGGGGGEEKMVKKANDNLGLDEDLINEYGIDVGDVEW